MEYERFATWGQLEALRTMVLLERFLPPAPATVLDVGGASGAYALPLAARGYAVHLLDAHAPHVEAAAAASERQAEAPLARVTARPCCARSVARRPSRRCWA